MLAAGELGRATAGTAIAPQPEDCRQPWPLLSRSALVGHPAISGIKRYEDYITGTINPQKARCWQFNENVRAGLAADPATQRN